MTVLVLALFLTCWGLAARTARTGWIVAIVLAFCAVAEIVLAQGWLLTGERFTLVVVFALAAAVVLAAGVAAERRQRGGLRRAGARVVAGVVMSVACIDVSLGGITVFVLAVLLYGSPILGRLPRRGLAARQTPGLREHHRQPAGGNDHHPDLRLLVTAADLGQGCPRAEPRPRAPMPDGRQYIRYEAISARRLHAGTHRRRRAHSRLTAADGSSPLISQGTPMRAICAPGPGGHLPG